MLRKRTERYDTLAKDQAAVAAAAMLPSPPSSHLHRRLYRRHQLHRHHQLQQPAVQTQTLGELSANVDGRILLYKNGVENKFAKGYE